MRLDTDRSGLQQTIFYLGLLETHCRDFVFWRIYRLERLQSENPIFALFFSSCLTVRYVYGCTRSVAFNSDFMVIHSHGMAIISLWRLFYIRNSLSSCLLLRSFRQPSLCTPSGSSQYKPAVRGG